MRNWDTNKVPDMRRARHARKIFEPIILQGVLDDQYSGLVGVYSMSANGRVSVPKQFFY